MTNIDAAAEQLARALRPTDPPHAYGWGVLVQPCRDALLGLIDAGWTPPAAGSEQGGLRVEIAALAARVDDLNRHVDRLAAQERALAEFRGAIVQAAHPCGRNPLGLDSGHAYSAGDIQTLLVRLLDAADRRAESSRRHSAKQDADRAAKQERTQAALFEVPGTARRTDLVPAEAAQRAGL